MHRKAGGERKGGWKASPGCAAAQKGLRSLVDLRVKQIDVSCAEISIVYTVSGNFATFLQHLTTDAGRSEKPCPALLCAPQQRGKRTPAIKENHKEIFSLHDKKASAPRRWLTAQAYPRMVNSVTRITASVSTRHTACSPITVPVKHRPDRSVDIKRVLTCPSGRKSPSSSAQSNW